MNKIYLFFIFSVLLACSKKEERKELAYPVATQSVIKKDVPIFLENIGHAEAINSVDIKSRVDGELISIHFKEGDYIKKGDILFTIDPREWKINLEKTKANLDEDIANLYIAKDKVYRYESLVEKEYISQLDFDILEANVLKLEAAIKKDEAFIEDAKLNLDYCYIRSPINGRAGILKTKKGNLIEKEANILLTIKQISPIYVTFSAPETKFPIILHYFSKSPLETKVKQHNEYISGMLDLVDNKIDKSTGTIKLRAIFDNNKKKLWPGQFVKTHLITHIQQNALIIPFEAVNITTKGTFVFVVKDNIAIQKKVTLGDRDGQLIIVEKGLLENDIVVTNGQINLQNKTKVFIQND